MKPCVRIDVLFLFCLAGACAPPPVPTTPASRLAGSDGRMYSLRDQALVVLVFFSPSCVYQASHDERLRSLYAAYARRGVRFFAIDSESTGSIERDVTEAASRHYPFPILRDSNARVARALHAQYSTWSVVAGPDGRVLYRGAIDSDGVHLHDDARMYLRDALEAALAGREPTVPTTEAPGCALTLW
jgi:peroxiredoxin